MSTPTFPTNPQDGDEFTALENGVTYVYDASSNSWGVEELLGGASLLPDIKPSLDLDFANTKSLDPRIDFDRSSTATYYDGETFAKAEENLLSDSSDPLIQTGLTTENTTTEKNAATAPDGTVSAIKVQDKVSTNETCYTRLQNFVKIPVGETHTVSVFLKRGNWDYLFFGVSERTRPGRAFVTIDIANGTITQETASRDTIESSSITDVGNGWYRVAFTVLSGDRATSEFKIGFADSANTTYSGNYASNGDNNYSGTGSNFFYFWGPQQEDRDQVTAYTPTTDQPITNYIPVLQTASSNEPRFDHDPITGESKGLLIEEQRTNLLDYSEDFSNSYWDKLSTVITPNSVSAPNGEFSADSVSVGRVRRNITYPDGSIAGALFIKADVGANYKLELESGADYTNKSTVLINSDTKELTIENKGTFDCSATAENVGNGWYRLSLFGNTGAKNGDGTIWFICRVIGNTGVIWGTQLEEGSFPTSYIKTEGSQVTRVADSASITGENFSEWYRQDEGSFFVEMEGISDNYNAVEGTGAYSLLKVGPNPDENAQFIGFEELYQIGARNSQSADGGVSLASSIGNTEGKSALSYTFGPSGTLSGSVNGNPTVSENISANYGDGQISQQLKFGADLKRLGGQDPNSSGNVRWKKITYYPKRLPDTILQRLTQE